MATSPDNLKLIEGKTRALTDAPYSSPSGYLFCIAQATLLGGTPLP
jgi:hypothetical protein